MPSSLSWPLDRIPGGNEATCFDAVRSNYLLDFHGSIQDPQLVLFMAGNQFRALPELTAAFRDDPLGQGVDRIFYATTPPGRLLDAMGSGRLVSGNFVFEIHPTRLWPDAFMAGAREQRRLGDAGHVNGSAPYARNRGAALLVRNGNPLDIGGVSDLARDDVRVAIPTREHESAAFASYSATLDAQGGAGLTERILAKRSTCFSRFVHHREVPQLIADDLADAAPVYRHLADYLVTHFPRVFDMVELPVADNHIDELRISTLLAAPRPAAAKAWREFLLGFEAGAILNRHGFDR